MQGGCRKGRCCCVTSQVRFYSSETAELPLRLSVGWDFILWKGNVENEGLFSVKVLGENGK